MRLSTVLPPVSGPNCALRRRVSGHCDRWRTRPRARAVTRAGTRAVGRAPRWRAHCR
jgi:hypothetical protein